LFPTTDPLTFEAPNFAYLMDSPIEFSDLEIATFTVPVKADSQERATFKVALHSGDRDAVKGLAADLEKIAAAAREVFGEFPDFEPGFYTFLMDYLPAANGDGMEHRNSTVLTSQASVDVPAERRSLLSTAAHELFHVWNVERIRPASLEPFNFEDANVSGELWLGEGVTSYYDGLLLQRAGLRTLPDTLADFLMLIEGVVLAPGRQFRSAVEMSRLAPFVDSASWVDVTNWQNTYISYYTFGAAIGLGLDLALRDRTDGRVTLDDYMRALWRTYGRPGGAAPGLVSKPYTLADARRVLGETSGDAAFAAEFFDRYIEGREVVDYARLLGRAGLVLRPRSPQRAWLGNVEFQFTEDGARLTTPTLVATPLYQAGLDKDDLLLTLDGTRIRTPAQLDAVLGRHRPGDRLPVTFVRNEETVTGTIVVAADPHLELVTVEQTGKPLTPAAQAFRKAWLGGR
jgi:predicted metalloprotease with PDZ domain